jgi:AhpD family alkylhydroperoxidase
MMALEFNKRLYTKKEMERFLKDAVRSVNHMKRAKKDGLLNDDFISRIMLVVTEVNGCEMCSYYHTSEALKNGVSQEEIAQMLSGSIDQLEEEESVALIFAQHYAETKGKPTKAAWKRLIKTYGKKKSLGILGATRAIMVGNTLGIAYGALKDRIKGNKVAKSSLGYELSIILGGILYLPVALVSGKMATRQKERLIEFSEG